MSKRIIISENMRRVRAAAKLYQAEYYQAWTIEPFDPVLAMRRNRRWLLGKARAGFEIIDIGIDPDRVNRSVFYAMEKEMLLHRNYPINQVY